MHDPPNPEQAVQGMEGQTLGASGATYELVRLLGRGGMGAVYVGRHRESGREVAVKVLPASGTSREAALRFRQEAATLAHLRHPNIVDMLTAGQTDAVEYLVIEYVRGRSLHDEISGGALGWRRAAHIGRQIAAALAVAHGAGVVHRDLKPPNIMLTERDGDSDHVKVLDFGIAKLLESCAEALGGPQGLTAAGMVLGTPRYMAPEQCMGDPLDGRTDLYALGVLLYEMVFGHPPFEGSSHADTIRAQVMDPVPPLPPRVRGVEIPAPLRALVHDLLAKSPSERPATAQQVVARLDALGGPAPSAVTLQTQRPEPGNAAPPGPVGAGPSQPQGGSTPSPATTPGTPLAARPRRKLPPLAAAP